MHHREGGELRRLLVRALVLEQRAAYDVLGGVAVAERRAAAAGADHLVAVADVENRFVAQFDSERNRSQQQLSVPGSAGESRLKGANSRVAPQAAAR